MGQSSQAQTTSSSSQPWAPAQPALQGILSGLGGLIPGAGSLSPLQQAALTSLTNTANAGNPYAGSVGNVATNLLQGGGATGQAPFIENAYKQYASSLLPLTNPASLNPYNTPGFSQALGTLNQDITNGVNGQFAAAGRDLSPANSTALARGLSQGEGQLLANQYNQNYQNYLQATGQLYGGANTTGGILSNLTQQGVQNQQAGIPASSAALGANTYGPNLQLQTAAQYLGIPVSQLQSILGVAGPIAGLGGQTAGQTTGVNTPSTLQDLYLASGAFKNLFGGSGGGGYSSSV